jgi:NADPH:quinone reductase-like Zn-dependent oxidoreductase
MEAVTIEKFGDPGGLAIVDLPTPAPGPGQMLIETEAIGVAGVDVVIRRGELAAYGFREGHIPGGEVAGRVSAVGQGVDRAWIGQRVWAFTGTGGGYAEQAVADQSEVLALPAELTAIDAVTLGSSGVVAHFGLAHARFAPGESVLVRGAAGSLGIMAVQLAAREGTVTVTTSSPERGRRLRELGATHVLDRSGRRDGRDDERGDERKDGRGDGRKDGRKDGRNGGRKDGRDDERKDGRNDERKDGRNDERKDGRNDERKDGRNDDRFDVIIDVVAGADLPSFLDRLNPNGRLVVVGAVGGQPPADFGLRLMAAFQRSLSFGTFSAATVTAPAKNAVRAEQFAAAARGELRAVVHEVLPLDQAADAHRKMDAGEVFGRIVLTSGPAGAGGRAGHPLREPDRQHR